jgi:hypothetical protein
MKIQLTIFKFPFTFVSQFSFIIHPHHDLSMKIQLKIEVHTYYFAWTKPTHLHIQSQDLLYQNFSNWDSGQDFNL